MDCQQERVSQELATKLGSAASEDIVAAVKRPKRTLMEEAKKRKRDLESGLVNSTYW